LSHRHDEKIRQCLVTLTLRELLEDDLHRVAARGVREAPRERATENPAECAQLRFRVAARRDQHVIEALALRRADVARRERATCSALTNRETPRLVSSAIYREIERHRRR
jgi:hypothetical protein